MVIIIIIIFKAMYYLYLVRCADNSLYCGITNNPKRRIKEHQTSNARSAKYTKTRRPVNLVYFERHKNITSAMKREREIKKWPKARKERLIKLNKPRTGIFYLNDTQ